MSRSDVLAQAIESDLVYYHRHRPALRATGCFEEEVRTVENVRFHPRKVLQPGENFSNWSGM